MYLTLLATLFFLASLVFLIIRMSKGEKDLLDAGLGCFLLFWLSTIFMALVIILLIVYPIRINVEILQFKSVSTTLETARGNPEISVFELAAMQQKVIEMNKWLAEAKFWAKHLLTNWFWPKEISRLEPII